MRANGPLRADSWPQSSWQYLDRVRALQGRGTCSATGSSSDSGFCEHWICHTDGNHRAETHRLPFVSPQHKSLLIWPLSKGWKQLCPTAFLIVDIYLTNELKFLCVFGLECLGNIWLIYVSWELLMITYILGKIAPIREFKFFFFFLFCWASFWPCTTFIIVFLYPSICLSIYSSVCLSTLY